jgi:hypothetical protein
MSIEGGTADGLVPWAFMPDAHGMRTCLARRTGNAGRGCACC